MRTATPRPQDCRAGPTTGVLRAAYSEGPGRARPSLPTRSPCAARAPALAPAPAPAPLCPPCARVGASSTPAPAASKLSGGDAGWRWRWRRWRRRRRGGGGSGPGRWGEESGSQGSPPAPPHSAPGRARSPVPRFLPADSCPVALNPANTQPSSSLCRPLPGRPPPLGTGCRQGHNQSAAPPTGTEQRGTVEGMWLGAGGGGCDRTPPPLAPPTAPCGDPRGFFPGCGCGATRTGPPLTPLRLLGDISFQHTAEQAGLGGGGQSKWGRGAPWGVPLTLGLGGGPPAPLTQ